MLKKQKYVEKKKNISWYTNHMYLGQYLYWWHNIEFAIEPPIHIDFSIHNSHIVWHIDNIDRDRLMHVYAYLDPDRSMYHFQSYQCNMTFVFVWKMFSFFFGTNPCKCLASNDHVETFAYSPLNISVN